MSGSLFTRFAERIAAPLSAVVVGLLFPTALHADEQLLPSVAEGGSCPTRAEVVDALARELADHGEDLSQWRVVVEAGDIRTLRLLNPEGTVFVARSFSSRDCEAVATAFAIIVRSSLASAGARSAEPPHAAELDAGLPEFGGEPAPASPTPRPDSLTISGERAPAAESGRFIVGTAAGGYLGLSPGKASPLLVLHLEQPVGPVALRAMVGYRPATEHHHGGMRVEQSAGIARADVGWRSAGTLWLQPTVGAGISVGRAVFAELDGRPDRVRVHPFLSGALRTGWQIRPSTAITAELGGLLFLARDRYQSEMFGAIGSTPRAASALLFGVEFRPF